jgi:hypothetical protein
MAPCPPGERPYLVCRWSWDPELPPLSCSGQRAPQPAIAQQPAEGAPQTVAMAAHLIHSPSGQRQIQQRSQQRR